MIRARQAILDHGGAERANVFTRIQLALFGAIPWRGVPVMPVEVMYLPKWFLLSTSGRCRTGHAPASSRSSSYKPASASTQPAGAELR